jgi:hypothetical protein
VVHHKASTSTRQRKMSSKRLPRPPSSGEDVDEGLRTMELAARGLNSKRGESTRNETTERTETMSELGRREMEGEGRETGGEEREVEGEDWKPREKAVSDGVWRPTEDLDGNSDLCPHFGSHVGRSRPNVRLPPLAGKI